MSIFCVWRTQPGHSSDPRCSWGSQSRYTLKAKVIGLNGQEVPFHGMLCGMLRWRHLKGAALMLLGSPACSCSWHISVLELITFHIVTPAATHTKSRTCVCVCSCVHTCDCVCVYVLSHYPIAITTKCLLPFFPERLSLLSSILHYWACVVDITKAEEAKSCWFCSLWYSGLFQFHLATYYIHDVHLSLFAKTSQEVLHDNK